MLQAAELRTLAAIFARTVRLEPFQSGTPRNKIAFALQTGDPEAMNDIVGISAYRNGLAYRNMDFIGGLENAAWIVIRVANLPPPLRTGDFDSQASSRRNRCGYDLAD